MTEQAHFKFGVEVARTIKHALELDKKNGDSLWQEAIKTELKQINDFKTFRTLERGESLRDFQRIPYHFVFDVKFDLRRKARLVAGGHRTDPPKEDIYSGVVGIETVRLAFLLASMNGLQICAADIGNAFLHGKTREKVYVIAGAEFDDLNGLPMIIDKGLYGLKSSSARFHEHLAAKLRRMGYLPSRADPDLWMKDMGTYYSYIATYIDDILAIDRDPLKIINEIKKDYILKGIGAPEYYLGGDVETLDEAWNKEGIATALSARTYIANVSEKMEKMLGVTLKNYTTPMAFEYHPELDTTPLISAFDTTKFRAMVGSCNWLITLGRLDINYAVQALSRYRTAPRQGHFEAMIRVLGYLKKFYKGRIIMDPNYRDNSDYEKKIKDYDNWKEFYPDAEEELPPNMPKPMGKAAQITCYVDADHAHDQMTRRSVTGIILLVNNTPIKWMSKRQKTIESSTYGSELVAAHLATEMVMEIRYALRMLGIPVDGPALMLGDNLSEVVNTTIPSSMLRKKHNAIAYHRVREAIAANILKFVHVDTKDNLADIMTKPLRSEQHYSLAKQMLFRQSKAYHGK